MMEVFEAQEVLIRIFAVPVEIIVLHGIYSATWWMIVNKWRIGTGKA